MPGPEALERWSSQAGIEVGVRRWGANAAILRGRCSADATHSRPEPARKFSGGSSWRRLSHPEFKTVFEQPAELAFTTYTGMLDTFWICSSQIYRDVAQQTSRGRGKA